MTGKFLNNSALFQDFANKYNLDQVRNIAVAVSGGPDSMALAHLLATSCEGFDINIHFLSVDHGLREETKKEISMVSAWVGSLNNTNYEHHTLKWLGDKPDSAVMEAARSARYDLMATHCANNNIGIMFVGHHQDDQAETFMIRLAKGSGLDGLSAMQEIRKFNDDLKIIRPLLSVPKEELVGHCKNNDIPYVEDPSNENEEYLRPRLRQSMAAMAEEGLTSKRLANTARRISRAREALEEISANAYQVCTLENSEKHKSFDWVKLKACPEEIAFRVVQQGLEDLRPDADYNVRMERLENLFESLWHAPKSFKPRTLGGFKISIKKQPQLSLMIEKE